LGFGVGVPVGAALAVGSAFGVVLAVGSAVGTELAVGSAVGDGLAAFFLQLLRQLCMACWHCGRFALAARMQS